MPAGRPSLFSESLVESICEQMSEGESLRAICRKPEMPGLSTVMRWLSENADFGSKYARAREAQAEVMDDKILSVAEETTNENAAASRVRIDAYKWRAMKLAPKKYGDKLDLEHTGKDGGAILSKVTVEFVGTAS